MDQSDTTDALASAKDARARDAADAIMAMIRGVHGGYDIQTDMAYAKLVHALREMQ